MKILDYKRAVELDNHNQTEQLKTPISIDFLLA